MDTITHTVLGACVGEAIAGRKIGKHAMFWGALANNIPDIDVFSSSWLNQADSLLAHRGFTHSFLFALTFPFILSAILSRWYRSKQIYFRDWWWIFTSGMFIHIFIDAMTAYGTGWFEPFSHYRVSFNSMFVADPLYTLPLLVCFVALLIIKKKKASRRRWVKYGLWLSTIYVLWTFLNKITVDNRFRKEMSRQNISYKDYFTTPTPLNNFLWYCVAKNDSGYNLGYYSLFSKNPEVNFFYRPLGENLLNGVEYDKDLNTLKRFSKDYYALQVKNDTLYLSDIRFGTLGGWEDSKSDFVFRYCLAKDANNDLVIQKGRFRAINKESFESLWRGIRGH